MSPTKIIPLSEPYLNGNEWQYVKECLDTGWVSSVGKYVNLFESAVATLADCKYAVACASGTAALHMALLVAGLKADEEVVMPALTFAAPAFAVRYLGAWPVFIDVDARYWQMDITKLQDFLDHDCSSKGGELINRRTKRTIRAILPVHLLGHPVDMAPLLKLARKYRLMVIEDVAESIGASYKDKMLGGIGDIGCFSFNGNKTITSGGGGVMVTNNKALAKRARHLTTQAKIDSIEYLHDEIGYNYRLTNVQAAIGLAQLECLSDRVNRKRKLAAVYYQAFSGTKGIGLPQQAPWAKSIWWLYTILVDKKIYGEGSRDLMRRLAKKGIQSRPLWHPLHTQKIFKESYAYRIEVANSLYINGLSIPSSVNLGMKEQEQVIELICK